MAVKKPPAPQPPRRGQKWRALNGLLTLDLPVAAYRVGHALISHANPRTGQCNPGKARLAREAGVKARSVNRALLALAGAGAIRVAWHGGGAATNVYQIDWATLAMRYEEWLKLHGLAARDSDPMTEMSQTHDRNDMGGMTARSSDPMTEMSQTHDRSVTLTRKGIMKYNSARAPATALGGDAATATAEGEADREYVGSDEALQRFDGLKASIAAGNADMAKQKKRATLHLPPDAERALIHKEGSQEVDGTTWPRF